MLKYILKRILQAIPVLLGVSVIVFLIMRVFSADPAPVVLGQHATPEAMQAWRDAQGLNDPIIVQYFDFLFGAIRGDLGESYYTHTPVLQELMARFPATVELALVAIVIAAVAGIALGVLSATHKNTAIDGIATILALVGVSMPIFWLGVLLIILFAGVLHVLPSSGRIDPLLQPVGGTGLYLLDTLLSGDFEAFGDALSHIILPALALSMYSMAVITRMTRSSMLETLNEDYVRTARAKGLKLGRVHRHHALRCAMSSRHHGYWPATWQSARRRHADRDGFRVAGPGQVRGRLHLEVRLPGGSGRRAADRRHLYRDQPDCRCGLCLP